MPKFSVVIPLYNKAAYILMTVQSVLQQQYEDFELIVVDDGSTDQGVEQLSKIKDPRMTIIQQKNQGVSVARNRGIFAARAEFVAFLDADDMWCPDYLMQIDRLTQKYTQADIFVTAYNVQMSSDVIHYSNAEDAETCGIHNYWLSLKNGYDFVWTSATVIRRKAILDAGGFKPGERIGQDLDLWARVAQNNPLVAYTDKRCVNYNRNAENNARTRVKVAYAQAFIHDLKMELQNEKRTAEEKKCIASKLRKKLIVYIFTLNLSGDSSGARKVILENKKFVGAVFSVMLFGASLLPKAVNCWVYRMRMKLF